MKKSILYIILVLFWSISFLILSPSKANAVEISEVVAESQVGDKVLEINRDSFYSYDRHCGSGACPYPTNGWVSLSDNDSGWASAKDTYETNPDEANYWWCDRFPLNCRPISGATQITGPSGFVDGETLLFRRRYTIPARSGHRISKVELKLWSDNNSWAYIDGKFVSSAGLNNTQTSTTDPNTLTVFSIEALALDSAEEEISGTTNELAIQVSNDLQGEANPIGVAYKVTAFYEPINNATCGTLTAPNEVTAGQSFNVSLTMNNTGAKAWSSSANYRLGRWDDASGWLLPDVSNNRVNLPSSPINLGSSVTFNFTVRTPITVGSRAMTLRMVQDGVEWFGSYCGKSIQINEERIPPLTVPPCTASKDVLTPGESVIWDVNPIGGNGTYSYQWSGAASGNTKSVTTSYSTVGTKTATVSVRSDTQSRTVSCSTEVRSNLSITCSAPARGVVGTSFDFRSTATGGTGGNIYTWTVTEPDGTVREIANGSFSYNTSYTPRLPGSLAGQVRVRDSSGQTATCNTSTTIYSLLTTSCSASPNPALVNETIYWTANRSGGTGSYTYEWAITDGWSGTGPSAQTIWTRHGTAGIKTANLTIRSGDQTTTARCTVTVNNATVEAFRITRVAPSCQAGSPRFEIEWQRSRNATTYYLYRNSVYGFQYVTTINDGSITSFTDTGVVENTSYQYIVYAANSYSGIATPWSSWYASSVCTSTPVDFNVNVPREYCWQYSTSSLPFVDVTWQRPTGTTATYYTVLRYSQAPSSTTWTWDGSQGTMYDPYTYFYDTRIIKGYKYKYGIVAHNSRSWPPFTNGRNNFVNEIGPIRGCPPRVLSCTPDKNRAAVGESLTFRMTVDPGNYAGDLNYSWSQVTGSPRFNWTAADLNTTALPGSFTSGGSGTVRADIYYGGSGPGSGHAEKVCDPVIVTSGAPTGLNAVCLLDGTATLSWNAVPGARAYQVSIDNTRSSGFDCVTASRTGSGDSCIYNVTTTSVNSGSAAGQTYQFWVNSVDSVTGIRSADSAIRAFYCSLAQGTVFIDTNRDGDWDQGDGERAYTGADADVMLRIYRTPPSPTADVPIVNPNPTTINSSGDYTFKSAPAGTYWLDLSRIPTGYNISAGNSRPVTISSTSPSSNSGNFNIGIIPLPSSSPIPSALPFIQTRDGDVHSNIRIRN